MRLDFDVRSSNPPAPMLQAAALDKVKHVARKRNGGRIYGTEPQGKLKKLNRKES